jgi:hypothetical protein
MKTGLVRTKTTKIWGVCAHMFVRTRALGNLGRLILADRVATERMGRIVGPSETERPKNRGDVDPFIYCMEKRLVIRHRPTGLVGFPPQHTLRASSA